MGQLENIEKYITGKTQWIRLFDVFILGPCMMYSGMTNKKLSRNLRALIFLSGTGTVVYNGWNFYRQWAINKKFGVGPLESLTEVNAPVKLEGGPI
jgi:hypothetical protein